jgi:hypothetical protein
MVSAICNGLWWWCVLALAVEIIVVAAVELPPILLLSMLPPPMLLVPSTALVLLLLLLLLSPATDPPPRPKVSPQAFHVLERGFPRLYSALYRHSMFHSTQRTQGCVPLHLIFFLMSQHALVPFYPVFFPRATLIIGYQSRHASCNDRAVLGSSRGVNFLQASQARLTRWRSFVIRGVCRNIFYF